MASRGKKKKNISKQIQVVTPPKVQKSSEINSSKKNFLWIYVVLLIVMFLSFTMPNISLRYDINMSELGEMFEDSTDKLNGSSNFSGFGILFAPTTGSSSVLEIVADSIKINGNEIGSALKGTVLSIASSFFEDNEQEQLQQAGIMLFVIQIVLLSMLIVSAILLGTIKKEKPRIVAMIVMFALMLAVGIWQFVIQLIMFGSTTDNVTIGIGVGAWLAVVANITGLLISLYDIEKLNKNIGESNEKMLKVSNRK